MARGRTTLTAAAASPEDAVLAATPLVVHVTTVDMSLVLLLGPQLRAFRDAGYEVVGVSAPGPYVAELESWGIRHVPWRHATRTMSLRRDVQAVAELGAIFRRLRPAVVHTHTPKAGIFGRLAARACRVPAVVNTVHGLYALPEDRWAKRTTVYGLERLAASFSHAELVQSAEDVEVLRRIGVPRPKLRLLGNGVDLARFDPDSLPPGRRDHIRRELGAGPEDVVCILVGRLVAEKGYPEMFAAAAMLRERAPHVRVVVAGPHEPDKTDAISETQLRQAASDGVTFLGLRHDVEELYGASDLFVLASHREGFPRAAMEAAAMGLPVVATDIRGCREAVDHGVTGLLVPARTPDALAHAVAVLAGDASLRTSMGRAARAKAGRDFDDRRVIEITLETYERLLSGCGRKRAT
jgi:glycosyltransferase involved in cell wall biosynthesis